jgi:hypothetical protein
MVAPFRDRADAEVRAWAYLFDISNPTAPVQIERFHAGPETPYPLQEMKILLDRSRAVISIVSPAGICVFDISEDICPWDVTSPAETSDGTVDVADFFAMLQQWGDCPRDEDANCPWDIDGDAQVDLYDFFALLQHWGPCED